MTPVKLGFKVYQGSTFSEVLRWESSKKVYKTITGITQSAPTVVTAASHSVPDGWRVKITNVGGMTEINSTENYHIATYIDSSNIEINALNSLGFKAYTTGGVIEYNEPVDLTGYTARMQIREKLDSSTVIHELTTENGGIVIDTTNYKVTVVISAADTALFTFNTAVYSLELISPTNEVYPFVNGVLTLVKEVTR
jgi:hypothetical protein